jgi:antitoxin (DNA-binding transcriptional repressor) of toxin-antitoxin stability system
MKTIPIHQAKANLSKYIGQAKQGKPVYIGGYGHAEVMLVALPKNNVVPLFGSLKSQLWLSGEAWDAASKAVADDFTDALERG